VAVIFSRQRWALGDACIVRDRALAPSWTLRLCTFRGVVDDERSLGPDVGLGIEEARARVSVVHHGQVAIATPGSVSVLGRGDAIFLAPITQARGYSVGDAGESVLELEWTATMPTVCSSFRLTPSALSMSTDVAEDLAGGLPPETLDLSLSAFTAELRANGIPVPELGPLALDLDAQRVMDVLDHTLSHLEESPNNVDLEARFECSRWTVHRTIRDVLESYGVFGMGQRTHWRSIRDYHRLRIARMLMTARGASPKSVARYVGYRSVEAMCHAFANGGLASPTRTRASIAK
jgi:AraC-like DNA-binding protein